MGAPEQIPGGFLRAIASGNLAKRWVDLGQYLGSWMYDCLGKSCKVFCKILKIPGGILGRLLGSVLWAIVQGVWPGCPAPRPPGCRVARRNIGAFLGAFFGDCLRKFVREIPQNPWGSWPLHGGILKRVLREIVQRLGGSWSSPRANVGASASGSPAKHLWRLGQLFGAFLGDCLGNPCGNRARL